MWYMAGYQQHTALAVSRDGFSWERPALTSSRHQHRLDRRRDSNTVWLDLEATRRARYKMAGFDDRR